MEENKEIIDILRKVVDPELRHNIVDLGLIYEVSANENNVKILMTFTTPLCPYGDMLIEDVKERLEDEGYKPEIEITFNPLWSIDKMSKEIREEFLLPIDI
ncbi:MAG: metal-sulfur cluster assembly factor [Nanoarchaeota archaeon]